MAKRRPLCRCGHRYYKHKHYPIQTPYCKAIPWNWYAQNEEQLVHGCGCNYYEPIPNLEYLEQRYIESVDKNLQ